MNKNQALEVLAAISELYPNKFELTDRKVEMLLPALVKMDFQGVMTNLKKYVAEKPYPPTIAEIACYPKEENVTLKKQQEWVRQARKVPMHKKQEFSRRLALLVERMAQSDE